MKKKESKGATVGLSFDEALVKLELLVEEMERGELTLEMAMQKHAEGTELSQFCLQQLQAAEAAVNKVIAESNGVLSEIELTLPEAD
ncbi:MAG TPA: exodeoxyribonuclease VII small subunit [Negativicutes bacterium]|nr:exodeoxyribonuclease VII small subunit [Negativicutes bacterium]